MKRQLDKEYIRKKKISKNIILIGTEGNNKTENNYFHNFNSPQSNYIIKTANGNATDPVKMVNDLISTMKRKAISPVNGDLVFCLFDTDCNKNKNKQIEEALKKAE